MKFFLRVRALGLLTSLVVAQQACKSDSATDAETIPLEVTALAPTVVDGLVGQIAPFSPRVRVLDATTKQPIANLPVSFSGGVSVPVARTDADGRSEER